jgi:hypothetical protein
MRRPHLLFLFSLLFVGGCHSGTLPNPNDPTDVGSLTPENIRDQFSCISDMLQTRLGRRQITQKEYEDLMQAAADKLLSGFSPDKVDPSKAWQIADLLVNARHWKEAKAVLETAVAWAKANHNEDRRVNDSLSLARVMAELDDVPGAITTARSVFAVRPQDSVPILYATRFRIVPAGRGKKHDLELAKLLEDAINIDMRAQVDPTSGPGRDFLRFRPFHVIKAWALVEDLYKSANRPELAAEAHQKGIDATKGFDANAPVQL